MSRSAHDVLTKIRSIQTPTCLGYRAWLTTTNGGSGETLSAAEQHALFEKQMEDLKVEREAIFGFTEEDQNAWTNAGGDHKHSASFMEMIDEARREQDFEESSGKTTTTNPFTQQRKDSSSNLENNTLFVNNPLTHLTHDGRDVRMVDVGAKEATKRVAVAESKVVFPPEVL